jgi:hypothetical protein
MSLHMLLIVSLLLLSCGLLLLVSYARDSALQSLARDCKRIERNVTRNAIARVVGRC